MNIAKAHAAPTTNLNKQESSETPVATVQPAETLQVEVERPAEAEKPKQEEPPKVVEQPKVVKPVEKPVTVPKPKATGSKEQWMAQAGIPNSDWKYVDYIVSKESSWNPNAINKSSGSCGLVQALPCSKLGANWRDPVHALRWQHKYVTARYGGYAGAYSFWKANNWY